MLLHRSDNIENVYFINSGSVLVLDQNYNLITKYNKGSFFGEYQALLDLKSSNIYRTQSIRHIDEETNEQTPKSCSGEVHLFLLDRKKFLEIVAQLDDGCSFEFYHKLALLRFKHIQRIKQ